MYSVNIFNVEGTDEPRGDLHRCSSYVLIEEATGHSWHWMWSGSRNEWLLAPSRVARLDHGYNVTKLGEVESREEYVEAWEKARERDGIFGYPVFPTYPEAIRERAPLKYEGFALAPVRVGNDSYQHRKEPVVTKRTRRLTLGGRFAE